MSSVAIGTSNREHEGDPSSPRSRTMRPSFVRSVPWRALAFLALALTGCEQQYRCETEILPDGRVKRSVCQPLESAPAAARDLKVWEQVTAAGSPDAFDHPGRKGRGWEFAGQLAFDRVRYTRARGTFPSVK